MVRYAGMLETLLEIINDSRRDKFDEASSVIENYVLSLPDFMPLLKVISIIPEGIKHDSTEEKLFAKASDAVFSGNLVCRQRFCAKERIQLM